MLARMTGGSGLITKQYGRDQYEFCCPETLEARAGIEPTYKDLQSSASPLCHRAGQLEAGDIDC